MLIRNLQLGWKRNGRTTWKQYTPHKHNLPGRHGGRDDCFLPTYLFIYRSLSLCIFMYTKSIHPPKVCEIVKYIQSTSVISTWLISNNRLSRSESNNRRQNIEEKRRNCSSFPQYFQYISNFRSLIAYSLVKCGCMIDLIFNSANLICRSTDISKYLGESIGLEITRVSCIVSGPHCLHVW